MVPSPPLDLLGAWDAADGGQRTRLLACLFERIKAHTDDAKRVRVVAIRRPGWRSFFEARMPLERETGLQAPSGKTHIEFTYWLATGTCSGWLGRRGARRDSNPLPRPWAVEPLLQASSDAVLNLIGAVSW